MTINRRHKVALNQVIVWDIRLKHLEILLWVQLSYN